MKFSPNNSFVSLKAIFLREVFESFVVYKSAQRNRKHIKSENFRELIFYSVRRFRLQSSIYLLNNLTDWVLVSWYVDWLLSELLPTNSLKNDRNDIYSSKLALKI